MRVSHETIYLSLFVQSRGALRRELAAHLRDRAGSCASPGAGTASSCGGRSRAWSMSASARPRPRTGRCPGTWEGDLIAGKANKSQIGTLVERTTRFTMLVPMPGGKQPDAFAEAVTPVIAGLPDALRRSLTWDQGAEMYRHAQIAVDADWQDLLLRPALALAAALQREHQRAAARASAAVDLAIRVDRDRASCISAPWSPGQRPLRTARRGARQKPCRQHRDQHRGHDADLRLVGLARDQIPFPCPGTHRGLGQALADA